MCTLPIDLAGLLVESDDEPWEGLPVGTRIGHVRLHVGDLREAERFYHEVIGFDIATRYPGAALFLAAGGYHHHLGVNVWAGVGAPAPPQDTAGLMDFEVRLPATEAVDRITDGLWVAGVGFRRQGECVLLQDP